MLFTDMPTNKSFAFQRLLNTSFSFFTTTFYILFNNHFYKQERVIEKQHKGGNAFTFLVLGYSHCFLFPYVHSHVLHTFCAAITYQETFLGFFNYKIPT